MLRNDKFIHHTICLSSVFSLIILQKFQSSLHKLYLSSVWEYSKHTGMKDKSTNIWLKPYIFPFETTFSYFYSFILITLPSKPFFICLIYMSYMAER